MKLTIAICTYNRHHHLGTCLRSIAELGYLGSHEIVVVDNSDDPGVRQANEDLVGSLAGARYLFSSPPGLSRARNVAVAQASGDVVAFIDDDVVCLPGWAEAVLSGFSSSDVVCVGGPVQPRWESPPPAWLGGELLHALGVIDPGKEARDLEAGEFFIGANVAFRRAELRSAGGFSEELGRTKTNLMGDEEIELQTKLRPMGRLWYTPKARVLHSIHAERCSLEWFLKRYAWQGVADAQSGNSGMYHYLGDLLVASSLPGAQQLLQALFARPSTHSDAVQRLVLARGLVAALLNKDVPAPGRVMHPPQSVEDREFELLRIQVPGDTRYLFVEFGVSHSFLYGAYGGIAGASFVNPKLDPAIQQEDCLRFLKNALFYASRTGIRAVVLLTADIVTWSPWEAALENRPMGVGLFGFLHRIPGDAAAGERFARLSREMDGLFVFAEPVRRFLIDQYRVSNITTVPIPPAFLGNAVPRQRRRVSGSRVSLGLLGEVRPGKGYESAVEILASAPIRIRERVKLVMAGGAAGTTKAAIADTCSRAGICADLHLHSRSPGSYKAIPDNLFAQAIADTDVVVYPFEPDHWHVFSGYFSDALIAGCWFIGIRGSVLGDIIDRYGLGVTYEHAKPNGFLDAVEEMVRLLDSGALSDTGRSVLLAEHGAANACRAVERILVGESAEAAEPSSRPRPRSPEATASASRD